MIARVEALRFRCLKYTSQPLNQFHVLVGPNASGKTTFLDVVGLLGQFVNEGLDSAIRSRTQNFEDLVWGRKGTSFEVVLEATIPAGRREHLANPEFDTVRYEVTFGTNPLSGEVEIVAEKALFRTAMPDPDQPKLLFPDPLQGPDTLMTGKGAKGTKTIVNKVADGNDNFYGETGKGWEHSFKLGPRKSALGNLPEDESKFPVATWFKELLVDGIQQIMLNSLLIRKASAPGQGKGFKSDGSNLPWVVADLEKRDPQRLRDWLQHVRTALTDLVGIRTVERADDKHRYLMLQYRGGLEIPSWMASDGTLRLLALTLPAYLSDFRGVYLIEEPENGIHPRAVETVLQSLTSTYDAQILVATHSPVILSIVDPSDVLCFAKNDAGATDIVEGHRHPALSEWRGETNLSTLFAGGVLG